MVLTPDDPVKAQLWLRGEAPEQIIDLYVPRGARGETGPQGPEGPPVNILVGETTMGPAAPGTVGPQGLQGVKGDPGGFTTGINILTADLNSFTSPGIYVQANGAYVLTSANYPITYNAPCILRVYQNGSTGLQEFEFSYATAGARTVYHRYWHSNGTFTTWQAFNSTRVDQTAGRTIYQWDNLNSREQLVYGDTGWRDISANLPAGLVKSTSANASVPMIRRIDNIVYLELFLDVLPDSAITTYCLFPVGFKPTPNVSRPGMMYSATTAGNGLPPTIVQHYVNTSALRSQTSAPSPGTIHYSGSWATVDAWPTTLPGSAHLSIPNV